MGIWMGEEEVRMERKGREGKGEEWAGEGGKRRGENERKWREEMEGK